MSEPRIEIKNFAEKMESRLKENDHKGGWGECSFEYLFVRLIEEASELGSALFIQAIGTENRKRIIKEAADVANFAMMISDRVKL
jgi:NTP pyrophosphatase (non-canonical NTP hydrolase)